MSSAHALAAAYGRVWASFQAASSTADGRHDTPLWRDSRGIYAACVIRIPAPVLQPALDALREALGQLPGARLHPDYFLHIMLQEIGFMVDVPRRSDEVSPDRVEEFAHAAVEPIAALSPLRLSFSAANAFEDAVFLEVGGGDRLVKLHDRLFDLAAIATPPNYAYLPHCTVAHFDGTTPVTPACHTIENWRHSEFGTITVDEIEIVTLDPTETYPHLETYAVIPLGG